MINTIVNDRFYEFYGTSDDGFADIVPDLYEKGIILANGSIFVQADSAQNADTKVYMWAADMNPDYPAKTSIPELPLSGIWLEL